MIVRCLLDLYCVISGFRSRTETTSKLSGHKMRPSTLLFSFPTLLHAREIVFPPVAGIADRMPGQTPLRLDTETDDDVDLSTDAMGGLTSFGHLPYVPCFSTKTDQEIDKYDIAVLGAPFDTATSYRPGARFGPHGIRDGSRRVRGPHSWNIYSGRNSFEEWAKLVDCGDAPLTFIDNTVALKQLAKAHKVLQFANYYNFVGTDYSQIISGRTANNASIAKTPRVLMLGGDHTITLAALRSTINHWGSVSVIHFDSHIDTWNPNQVAGGVTEYASVNHVSIWETTLFPIICSKSHLASLDILQHLAYRAAAGLCLRLPGMHFGDP